MKNLKYVMIVLIIVSLASSCKKDNSGGELASLNIVNADIDASSFLVYLTSSPGGFYQNQAPLYYGANLVYGTPAGVNPLSIFNPADTNKALLTTTLNLKTGGIYSLYLAGQSPQIDTFLLEDILPLQKTDEVGVRFVNLSPGSAPMSINLDSNPATQTEFDGLGYKQISPFKSYPGSNGIASYNFEIRDKASGDLLTSFSWNFLPNRNYTLVINGSTDPSSSTPVGVFQVNNF